MRRALSALLLVAAVPARAGDVASEARASYRIETGESSKALKVGEQGKVVLAIQPKEKIHVHPQAPLRATLTPSAGLKIAKPELGRADAVDSKSDAPRFEIPVTAAVAGPQELKANLEFFICSDTWCVKQVQAVTVPVAVR
jgi:hypothetical protein